MCGRYTLRKPPVEELVEAEFPVPIETPQASDGFQPRYNIAPTQACAALVPTSDAADRLALRRFRWGLVPSWAKSAQATSPLINARAETVLEKPAFRSAFQRRRCLIPADGFYEWRKRRGTNVPFFFHLKGEPIFHFAGLWEVWHGPGAERIESFTILTTRANGLMSKFHDRMPVILDRSRIEPWLRGAPELFDPAGSQAFFEPLPDDALDCRPVSASVNNNRNDGPQCLEPPEEAPVTQLDFGL